MSESGSGWFASIVEQPERGDGPIVVSYCPPCAERELQAQPREHEYT